MRNGCRKLPNAQLHAKCESPPSGLCTYFTQNGYSLLLIFPIVLHEGLALQPRSVFTAQYQDILNSSSIRKCRILHVINIAINRWALSRRAPSQGFVFVLCEQSPTTNPCAGLTSVLAWGLNFCIVYIIRALTRVMYKIKGVTKKCSQARSLGARTHFAGGRLSPHFVVFFFLFYIVLAGVVLFAHVFDFYVVVFYGCFGLLAFAFQL